MRVRKGLGVSLLAIAAAALLSARAAPAAQPQLTLPEFKALEARATESVNISLDPSLIGLATQFLNSDKPDDAAVLKAIRGVKGIYVRSFTFDSNFTYPKDDVDRVLSQLSAPAWQRLVQVHNQKDRSDVGIYICVDQSKPSGLAIISSEPRQFTIVNIVGTIDLKQLHALEGSFGIPHLQLGDQGRK
ncbi:MAG: DUF4252 domain-containing protein [Steroidobacteraceae bacterium]